MSEYKRLVSYLYLYENGVKLKNTGYAKIDIRDGKCRMDIRIRGIAEPSGTPQKAYIFLRDGDDPAGVALGSMAPGGGGYQLKAVTDEANLMGSGVSFDSCGGIIITCGKSMAYATEWDDRPVNPMNLREYVNDGGENPAELVSAEEETVAEAAAPDEENVEYEAEDTEAAVTAEEAGEVSAESAEDDVEVDEVMEDEAAGILHESAAVMGEVRAESADNTEEKYEERETELQEEAAETTQEFTYESKQVTAQASDTCTFDSMKSSHEGINAFADDEIGDCFRVTPQDLVNLPKKEWILGNNSFLLHGFYNYHYLLMGRKRTEERDVMILGVPGTYYQQEKMMAGMFGFPFFKAAEGGDPAQGTFGYWYREMEEDE